MAGAASNRSFLSDPARDMFGDDKLARDYARKYDDSTTGNAVKAKIRKALGL